MNTCPACSKTVHPNDLVCPHCGISLHPGTATSGPASWGGGMGMSVVAIVVIAIVGIVLVVGCLGVVPFFFMAGIGRAVPPPPPMVAPPSPVPMSLPVEPPDAVPALEAQAGQAPSEQTPADKVNETP
jgi:hypothetical protein